MTETIQTVEQLEGVLSTPTRLVVEGLARLKGDMLFLGVGGKMGPALALMARRGSEAAGTKREIIGVSRFSSPEHASKLKTHGIKTLVCDLLDEQEVNRLPEAPNVFFLAGMKFGSSDNQPLTWAMNSYLPALICRKFRRSCMVALSTGNVYGLVPVTGKGAEESDAPAPLGEYAMSCLGRERMFEYFSRKLEIPVTLVRLNYCCDLRYGVLVDLAQKIWSGEPVDLSMGHFNTIWQADANAMILLSLLHASCPPLVLNLTGPEVMSVRKVCEQFARLMRREPRFIREEGSTALLSNAQKAFALFGRPRVGAAQLIGWVADWIIRDRPTLGKPTHYESRHGKF